MELDLKNGEGAVSYPMEAQPKKKEGSNRHQQLGLRFNFCFVSTNYYYLFKFILLNYVIFMFILNIWLFSFLFK